MVKTGGPSPYVPPAIAYAFVDAQYVRAEWEHALSLGRQNFVRPTYWEDPFPRTSSLPPPELDRLHFTRLEGISSKNETGQSGLWRGDDKEPRGKSTPEPLPRAPASTPPARVSMLTVVRP